MQSFGMPLDALRSPALPEQHTIERDGSTWYSIVLRYELDRAVLPAAGLDQVEPLQPQLFDMEGIDNATQTTHAAAGVAGRQ